MAERAAAVGRSGGADDFAMHGQRADVAFGGVVLPRDAEAAEKAEDPFEVLGNASRGPREVGILLKRRSVVSRCNVLRTDSRVSTSVAASTLG